MTSTDSPANSAANAANVAGPQGLPALAGVAALAVDSQEPLPLAKSGKNRLHLDQRSRDYEAAVRRALEVGAVRAADVYEGDRWTVLRDPEGNEFCILRPRS